MVLLDTGHMHTRVYLHTHTHVQFAPHLSSAKFQKKEAIVSVWIGSSFSFLTNSKVPLTQSPPFCDILSAQGAFDCSCVCCLLLRKAMLSHVLISATFTYKPHGILNSRNIFIPIPHDLLLKFAQKTKQQKHINCFNSINSSATFLYLKLHQKTTGAFIPWLGFSCFST